MLDDSKENYSTETTVWLIDMLLRVFEQQWRSLAQRDRLMYIRLHRQILVSRRKPLLVLVFNRICLYIGILLEIIICPALFASPKHFGCPGI